MADVTLPVDKIRIAANEIASRWKAMAEERNIPLDLLLVGTLTGKIEKDLAERLTVVPSLAGLMACEIQHMFRERTILDVLAREDYDQFLAVFCGEEA